MAVQKKLTADELGFLRKTAGTFKFPLGGEVRLIAHIAALEQERDGGVGSTRRPHIPQVPRTKRFRGGTKGVTAAMRTSPAPGRWSERLGISGECCPRRPPAAERQPCRR